jgi:nucleotide-binding universal stress UspA family protein
MFSKILLGYDGTRESDDVLKVSANIAEKYGSEIKAVNILPEHTEFTKSFSESDRNKFDHWVEDNLKKKHIKKLDKKKEQLGNKGIKFVYDVKYGLPYKEILGEVKKENYNLIALGKGRFGNKSILGGTAKKVLRNTSVTVLVSGANFKKNKFKKILVPTDIHNVMTKDLSFAQELADKFNSKIYLLNIVEKGNHKYPVEFIETLKGNSYNTLSQNLLKAKNMNDVELRVKVAQNSWLGIKNFIEEENIDLVVMMSYGGDKIRSEFLGSVAEKVIEYSTCPVIVLSP